MMNKLIDVGPVCSGKADAGDQSVSPTTSLVDAGL